MSDSIQFGASTSEVVDAEHVPVSNSPANSSANYTPYSPPPIAKTSSHLRWWVIVLLILAAPMLLALLSVPFSIVMAIASFVFAFAVTGVSLIGAGFASLISVPFIIGTGIGQAVLTGGVGLMSIGFGIIFLLVTIALVKAIFKGLRFVWERLFKREKRHEYGFDGGIYSGQQQ